MKKWLLEKILRWNGYEGYIAWKWSDTFKITKGYPHGEKVLMSTKDTYTHFNVYKNNQFVGALRI